jgi:succinate dehydrogenase flavin-adding protein (antitoxin of CptAB toxin-antitoxin module)
VYVSTPKRTQMDAKFRSASRDRGINENDFIILPFFGTVKGSVVLSSDTNPTIRHFAGADDPQKQM